METGSRSRRLALYNQVVALSKQGGTIQGIARQLQISRQTVRKFVQAPSFPEWQKASRTKSAIDPYRPYTATNVGLPDAVQPTNYGRSCKSAALLAVG